MSNLRDYSTIKQENVRTTTAPLKIEMIKEFFENKDLFFIVDYSNSEIKGNMFLTYLSNLDLPCEIDFKNASKEEKFDLIRTYMQTRNISTSDVLKLTVADLVLTYKKIPTDNLIQNQMLTPEERNEFISTNLELFQKWDQFISSSFVYLISIFPELAEAVKIKDQYPEINDPTFIGLNIVNMYDIPGFLEHFLTKPLHPELKYFKPQFEEYMFKGKNFYHYFRSDCNTFIALLGGISKGEIKTEDLVKFINAPE